MGSSALVRQLVLENENSEFKPAKLRLKIDFVSYPAQTKGLVNMVLSPVEEITVYTTDKI